MKNLTLTLAFLALTACTTPNVYASASEPHSNEKTMTTQQQTTKSVSDIENYLNGLKTLEADFTQTTSDGSIVGGKFYLNRPGKLRFEYDQNIGDYIVADGLFIHYWDHQLKEHNNAPIGMTLADFLLTKNLKLSGEVTVERFDTLQNGNLRLILTKTEEPSAGKLALLFQKDPLQLKKWRIEDATGAIIEVALNNIKTDHKLSPQLFVFKPPIGYEDEWQNR